MRRRVMARALAAALWIGAGCGGGNLGSSRTIQTGGSGKLADAAIGPALGAVFIPRSTAFQIAWPAGTAPPDRIQVALRRYKEARGGLGPETTTQRIQVDRVGTTNAWNIRRDGEDLDKDGVYFLELSTPGQAERVGAYIVSSDRSVAEDVTRGDEDRVIDTGSATGRLSDVQISPAPGALFIPRGTAFQIAWSAAAPPPPQVTVRLWRYQEARGGEPRLVGKKPLDPPARQGNAFVWNIKRRDSFDLDQGGVYFLELDAGGEKIRAACIVSNDR